MDRCVTSLLVMQEDGHIEEQAGGYSDWEARGGRLRVGNVGEADPQGNPVVAPAAQTKAPKRKLSYKEQRELADLPSELERLETEQNALETAITDPGFYRQDNATVVAHMAKLSAVGAALDTALERWADLES